MSTKSDLIRYAAMLGAMSPELFSVDVALKHDAQWFKKYHKKRGKKRNKPVKGKR